MRSKIIIKTTPALANKYKRLLRQEWTEQTFRDALELCLCQLPSKELRVHFGLEQTSRGQFKRASIPSINSVKAALESVHLPTLPPLPESIPNPAKSNQADSGMAVDAALVLTIQANYDLSDATGFYEDCQSLLFLCSAHFHLPRLKERRLTAEWSVLANALAFHVTVVWEHDVAHQQSLKGALAEALEDAATQETALVDAFLLTSAESEDFLIKAAAAWLCMCERKRYTQARDFLLEAYRRALPSQLDEIREMLDDTYEVETVGASVSET